MFRRSCVELEGLLSSDILGLPYQVASVILLQIICGYCSEYSMADVVLPVVFSLILMGIIKMSDPLNYHLGQGHRLV